MERHCKDIKLKIFQKVSFSGAQIPKSEKKSFKNAEIWGNFKKFMDLGTIKTNFLKIF